MLLNDKHAYSLWTHCPDLSECLTCRLFDLSECLICLNVWISEFLICLNVWMSEFPNVWFVWMSDLSECLICLNVWISECLICLNVWMSECLICLMIWFTWLSVLPESLKVWWSDSSDFRQSDNQTISSTTILIVYCSSLQTFNASSIQLSLHTAYQHFQDYCRSGIVSIQDNQIISIRISAITDIQ